MITELNFDLISLANASKNSVVTSHSATSEVRSDAGGREIEFTLDSPYIDLYSKEHSSVTLTGLALSKDSCGLYLERNTTSSSSSLKLKIYNSSVELTGKTVKICGITDLWGNEIEIVKKYDKSYSETEPDTPEFLLDEKFRESYIPAGQEYTHASGWRISGSGGKIEGRNTAGGFYIKDTDSAAGIAMTKQLQRQTTGRLIFEAALNFADLGSRLDICLGDSVSDVLKISFCEGTLQYRTEEEPYTVCNYSAVQRIGIKAEIDLTNGLADIFVNGKGMAMKCRFWTQDRARI